MSEDVDRIEREIEETRGQLADTVEALAYKADVPARAKEKAAAAATGAREKATVVAGQAKEKATVVTGQAKEKAGHAAHAAQEAPPRTKAAAGAAAVLAAVGSIWLFVRRRRS